MGRLHLSIKMLGDGEAAPAQFFAALRIYAAFAARPKRAVSRAGLRFGFGCRLRGLSSKPFTCPKKKDTPRRVLLFGFRRPEGGSTLLITMLVRNEFALRQGFGPSAQNACTAHRHRPTVWGPGPVCPQNCSPVSPSRKVRFAAAFFMLTHKKRNPSHPPSPINKRQQRR